MKIKFYSAGKVLSAMQIWRVDSSPNNGSAQLNSCPTANYYDINGNTQNKIICGLSNGTAVGRIGNERSISNSNLYRDLSAYASTQTESQFSLNDYAIDSADIVGTSSCALTTNLSGGVITVTVQNSSDNDITFNSIKFSKVIYISGSHDSIVSCRALVFSVFLDEPCTVSGKSSKAVNISITFDI